MKNLITILFILISYNLSSQKWIKDTNCDEQSYEVLNEALEHFFNLEHLMAVGMAKAAYMIDSGCECSKLILAAAASPNPNWGTRKAKLDDINIQLLTSEEKTWYNISKYLKTLSDISLAALLILYFHPFSENIVLTGKVKTFIFTFSIAIIVNGFVSLFN